MVGWTGLIGAPACAAPRDPNTGIRRCVDFWRVTRVDPPRLLELRAEMKLPGEALLSFEVHSDARDAAKCTLIQTARFKPRGLMGLAYWYAVLPLHGLVFNGMLNGIRRAAEQAARLGAG